MQQGEFEDVTYLHFKFKQFLMISSIFQDYIVSSFVLFLPKNKYIISKLGQSYQKNFIVKASPFNKYHESAH